MSFTGVVIIKAVDAGGPGIITQDFIVGGGAANAEDAVSLLGTGDVTSFANGEIEEFWFEGVDGLPDNATITNLRIVCGFTGLGTVSCRYNNATDGANPPFDSLTGFQDFPDSTPFGGLGAWTQDDFKNDNNFGVIRVTGGVVIGTLYAEVSFTIPDPVTPATISAAGGDTVTFQASSGNFIDSDYEFIWQDFPTVTNPITVVDGRTGTDVSPARTAGAISVSIQDPQGNIAGTRPYNNPSFIGAMLAINVGMEFLEDPSGTPTEYAITGGVTMGSSYMGYLSKDISGIYTLTPNKRNDTVYVRAGSTTTQDVQIPTPFAEFGFVECDDE